MDLWLFIGALVVVYLIPGPDMILILQTGASRGRPQALATVSGLALARGLHVTLAALGLAALFRSAPWTFEVARGLGASYLIWLATRVLTQTPDRIHAITDSETTSGHCLRAAWRRGLLTNLLNPKSLLFCSTLLPQFMHPEGSLALQFAWLGAILVGTGVLFDLVYATAGVKLGHMASTRPGLQRLQHRVLAGVLAGFGIHLLLEGTAPWNGLA